MSTYLTTGETVNVVEMPQPRPAQLTFEGVEVIGITDTLKSLKSQPATRERRHFETVRGWFEGRVVEIRMPEKGEGSAERQQIVEVLRWGTE